MYSKRIILFLILAASVQAALTGTDRGTAALSSASTTITLNPTSNFTAGAWAVLVVAGDNTGGGGAFNITTTTDTLGNTWTRRQDIIYDPGSASAGVQGAFFTTPQNAGTITTGTTITVTFGANTTAKAVTLMEVSAGAGFTVSFVTGASGTGSATTTPTVTTSSITNGDMVIGGLFNEYGTAQTVTGDGDAVGGTWLTQQTTEVGTTDTGMTVQSQRKIVGTTATQTYNPTLGTSSDVILGWIQLREVAAANSGFFGLFP